jgi:endogenous inhibitor of DNA gyrase (YacG/DUF329 family)
MLVAVNGNQAVNHNRRKTMKCRNCDKNIPRDQAVMSQEGPFCSTGCVSDFNKPANVIEPISAKGTLHALAVAFVERSKTLEYKGKARDKAVMDWFLGAALALELEGKKETAEHIKRVACWILAIRGYSEVEKMAQGHVETYDAKRCLETEAA